MHRALQRFNVSSVIRPHSFKRFPLNPLLLRHHYSTLPPAGPPQQPLNTGNTTNTQQNAYNSGRGKGNDNNQQKKAYGSTFRTLKILVGTMAGVAVGGSALFFFLSPYTPKEFYQQFFRSIRSFWVFTVITLDYKLSLRGLTYGTQIYRETRSQVHKRAAEWMLWLANANKGIFIKAGQHLASLTHLLPTQYTDTLCVLQDKAPYVTFEDVCQVFVQEFGCHPDDIFEKFERRPIASASLAQVHRAYLNTPQGTKEVAVKIQYPGLLEKFSGDVKTFEIMAKCVSWAFPDFQFGWIVDEFKHSVAMELDFENEAKNSERIARNFSWRKQFAVPKVYWAQTKKRILTMEYIHGIKITDSAALQAAGYNLYDVAYQLVDLFSDQVFIHGFVHSDPHPGNILVRRSVTSRGRVVPEIVLLDHGLYRKLDEDVRRNYCKLWQALVLGREKDVELYGRKLGAGEYCKYLAMMLTFRPKIGRLDQAAKIERDEIKKLATELWESGVIEDISNLLESLPRDLLLVLRTNDLIMSINKELGFPVNRFLVMARSAIRGIVVSEDTAASLVDRLKYNYGLFAFNMRVSLFAFAIRMYKFYRSWFPGRPAEIKQ